MCGCYDLDLWSVQALALLPVGGYVLHIGIPFDWLLIRIIEGLKQMVYTFEVTVYDVEVVYIGGAQHQSEADVPVCLLA